MRTYQKIEQAINNIKCISAASVLHDQLIDARNLRWTREELSLYIKSDHDVTDHFDCENIIDDVREIQDFIINYEGE